MITVGTVAKVRTRQSRPQNARIRHGRLRKVREKEEELAVSRRKMMVTRVSKTSRFFSKGNCRRICRPNNS